MGLALDNDKERKAIGELADLGHGTYFDARNPDEVSNAIRAAVSAPFQILDQGGKLVGSGTVGGAPVEVPPGTYRVVVLSDPPVTYEGIVIGSEDSVTLTLPDNAPQPSPTPPPSASPTAGASPSSGGSPPPGASPLPQASATP